MSNENPSPSRSHIFKHVINAFLFCIGIAIVIQNHSLTQQLRTALNPPPGVEKGKKIRHVVGVGMDGKLRQISGPELNDALLIVLSPACWACTEDQPHWKPLTEALRLQKKTKIIWISIDSPEKTSVYCKKYGIPTDEVLTEPSYDTFLALNMNSVPSTLALLNGEVVDQWNGLLKPKDWNSLYSHYGIPAQGAL